jgi:hypothetical protein
MFIIGILFNPMNVLAYSMDHLYFSVTLFYSGLLMASNMIWGHELVKYATTGNVNYGIFTIGIIISIGVAILLRNQYLVDDNEWLKRMIGHHSTALTTSEIMNNNTKSKDIQELSNKIIQAQTNEISEMKRLLRP